VLVLVTVIVLNVVVPTALASDHRVPPPALTPVPALLLMPRSNSVPRTPMGTMWPSLVPSSIRRGLPFARESSVFQAVRQRLLLMSARSALRSMLTPKTCGLISM
jgi:hypothetical protein